MQSIDFTLALAQGQVIHCQYKHPHTLVLHHSQNREPLYFSGIFADAIVSLTSQQPQRDLLQRIERTHPYLQGLSQARTTPSAQQLLLGDGLGMLFIELTSQCNERCLHCYADSHPERSDFLAIDDVRRVLQQARDLGRAFVQFTGGDPLIHPHLLEALAYAQSLDFQGIEIYTNGLLLSDKLLQAMLPYQPQISFSLYADNAEVHDHITRVPGSWKRTLAALQRSLNQGFEVRVGVVIMAENAECVAHLPTFLQEHFGIPVEHIRFDPVNRVGRGSLTHLPEHIRIQSSHALGQGETRRGKLCISAQGTVHPCIFSRNFSLGHIRQHSLHELLHQLQYRTGISDERWKSCQEQLSCSDCQMVACLLTSTHTSGERA